MNKLKLNYFLIGVMIALFVSICACFAIISTGFVDTSRLIIYSGSAEKAFDNTELTSGEYGIKSGQLKNGHQLVLTTYGKQKEIGASYNYFHYAIIDEVGNSVTNEYRVIEVPGLLIVHEEGWFDLEKLEKLKDAINRMGITDFEGAGLDIDGLQGLLDDIDWDDYTKEEQDEIIDDLAAAIAGAILGGGADGEQEGGTGGDGGSGGNGAGGGSSGRFDSNLQREGSGFGEGAYEEVFKIYSNKTQEYYIRFESFGDYNGSGWEEPRVYDDNIVSPNYYAGLTLMQNGIFPQSVQIQNVDGNGAYYTTYYAITGNSEESGDVYFSLQRESYSIAYCEYDYLNDLITYTPREENLTAFEERYREFVYKEYLTIDERLKNQLLNLTGFNTQGKLLAKQIKNYVQNAATYNLKFQRFPDGEDMILYFLTQGKEGICQHFAASATMIFRAYGIPARYTCGYKANAYANEWASVTGMYGHAWVEIYVDGFGWVQVEVTGGAYDEARKANISIETASVSKSYDGKPFTADEAAKWVVTSGKLLSGHKIVATVPNDLEFPTFVGEKINDGFGYKIVDAYGQDVTDLYEIQGVSYGELKISKRSLSVYAEDGEYEYTREDISHKYIDYKKTTGIEDGIIRATGDYITVIDGTVEREIGEYDNVLQYSIVNANGDDVYDQYQLSEVPSTLKITKIKLSITTVDYEHQYDGEKAIREEYLIDESKILSGHWHKLLENSTENLISKVGESTENKFLVIIYDVEQDVDVTDSFYEFEYNYGTLEVIKRQVYIRTGSDTQYYDEGITPATNPIPEEYYNARDYGLVALLDGHVLVVDGEAPKRYKPGSEDNECKYKVVKESDGSSVDEFYELIYEDINCGKLRVFISLVITTETKSFDYNPYEKRSATDASLSTSLMEGHSLEIINCTEKIRPGTYENVCTYRIVDASGVDVTNKYYEIEYAKDVDGKFVGKLIIREPQKTSITITAQTKSKIYDGTPLEATSGYQITSGGLRDGHYLKVVMQEAFTFVGKKATIKSVSVVDGDGIDVSPYYSITKLGTLEITPRSATVTSADRTYTERTEDERYVGFVEDVSAVGLADGDILEVTQMTGFITSDRLTDGRLGWTENTVEYKIMRGSVDVTKNYNISEIIGKIWVQIESRA